MKLITACEFFYKFAGTASSAKKRGLVCIEAEHELNSSNLDKFPINKTSEARKALMRINTFTKAPKWWKGSLDQLKTIIKSKIEKVYKVEISGENITVSKKSS